MIALENGFQYPDVEGRTHVALARSIFSYPEHSLQCKSTEEGGNYSFHNPVIY